MTPDELIGCMFCGGMGHDDWKCPGTVTPPHGVPTERLSIFKKTDAPPSFEGLDGLRPMGCSEDGE